MQRMVLLAREGVVDLEHEYKCSICGLHYKSRKLAAECYKWCSGHDSCNLEVANQSLEAQKSRKAK